MGTAPVTPPSPTPKERKKRKGPRRCREMRMCNDPKTLGRYSALACQKAVCLSVIEVHRLASRRIATHRRKHTLHLAQRPEGNDDDVVNIMQKRNTPPETHTHRIEQNKHATPVRTLSSPACTLFSAPVPPQTSKTQHHKLREQHRLRTNEQCAA